MEALSALFATRKSKNEQKTARTTCKKTAPLGHVQHISVQSKPPPGSSVTPALQFNTVRYRQNRNSKTRKENHVAARTELEKASQWTGKGQGALKQPSLQDLHETRQKNCAQQQEAVGHLAQPTEQRFRKGRDRFTDLATANARRFRGNLASIRSAPFKTQSARTIVHSTVKISCSQRAVLNTCISVSKPSSG